MKKLTASEAAVVGRIRDALRTLGYAVPTAREGGATVEDLAALAPAIQRFAQAVGISEAIGKLKDPHARARAIASIAEKVAARGSVAQRAVGVAEILASGFMAYRVAKKKGGAAAFARLMNTVHAATSR